ncbi:MAG TPA: PAS domain S-box protein [Methanobacterium sp.]|nr:PAS domain S-box protein [Methanobacterium sp.]
MPLEQNDAVISKLKNLSEIFAYIILIGGLIIFLGWAFNISIFKTPGTYFSAVKTNTALCFIFLGLSLWFLQEKRLNNLNLRIGKIFAFLAALIGMLTLIEYLTGINLLLDQIIFSEPLGAIQTTNPNRMANTTALEFLLIGIAFLIIDKKINRDTFPAQYIVLISGSITFLISLGYIYNTSFYNLQAGNIPSPYTTILFFLLFFGFLFLRPDTGIMELLTSNRISGAFGRRIIPAVIFIPLIIGFSFLLGDLSGLYDVAFGYALIVFITIVILLLIVWNSMVSLDKVEVGRLKAEEAIKESEYFLDKIINSISDPVFVKDGHHRWALLNDAYCEFMGYSREELLGKSDYDFFPKNEVDVFWEYDEKVIKSGKESINEEEFTDSNNSLHNIITKKSLYTDISGEKYIVGIIRDVTELKNIEKERESLIKELKRSNHELQQFAYITSHDLQEPLRNIASFTQLLERRYKGKLDLDADEYIEFIVEGSKRMKEMIQGLLDYSKIGNEEKELKPVNIENILKTATFNLKRSIEENNAIITNDALPEVMGDESQLIRLFQNLIGNSIKFKIKICLLKFTFLQRKIRMVIISLALLIMELDLIRSLKTEFLKFSSVYTL